MTTPKVKVICQKGRIESVEAHDAKWWIVARGGGEVPLVADAEDLLSIAGGAACVVNTPYPRRLKKQPPSKPHRLMSCGHTIPENEILRVAASIQGTPANAASAAASVLGRRQTPHAGPGRPPYAPRCSCGLFTLKQAQVKKHVCSI